MITDVHEEGIHKCLRSLDLNRIPTYVQAYAACLLPACLLAYLHIVAFVLAARFATSRASGRLCKALDQPSARIFANKGSIQVGRSGRLPDKPVASFSS